MAREIEDPVVEDGNEMHPAFGLIGASRMTSTPGSILFDSDIKHGQTVLVRIKTATRRREYHHDWIHGREELIEVELSESQWASFVSSMNIGDGVPCTILHREDKVSTPGLPYAPRLAQSMDETRGAAHEAFDDIKEAMTMYMTMLESKAPAKDRNEALRNLNARIANAVSNVDYAGTTLTEHAENVVTKARADIEAVVITKARQLGIDAGDLGEIPMLGQGEV